MRLFVLLSILLIGIALSSSSPIGNSESKSVSDDGLLNTLFRAAETGDEKSLQNAIDKGVNINSQNEHGWTALCVAVWNRHDNIAKILIEKGADVNVKLWTKWTALHMAAENGHVGLVKLLIENGANIDAATWENWTPINLAIANERYQAVEFLSKVKKDGNKIAQKKATTEAPQSSTHPTNATMKTAPEDISGRIDAMSAALIVSEENEIQHSAILWSVVGIGLGIVIGIVVVNIINSLRGRMQRSEVLEEEGQNDTPSTPYVRFNVHQQTGMQQFLGNISKFKPKW